jgi:hypothetical protein
MSESILKAAASLGVSPETIEGALKGGARATPGVLVVTWNHFTAMPIDKWVQLAVLVFTVLQIVVLVRREFWKRKESSK